MLLKTGHALLNDEAGQTERATVSVQCFYAGDDLIGRMCSLLATRKRHGRNRVVAV